MIELAHAGNATMDQAEEVMGEVSAADRQSWRFGTCLHEAGHCVAAWYVSFPLSNVSVPVFLSESATQKGVTRFKRPRLGDKPPPDDADDWHRSLILKATENQAIMLMAGCWAFVQILDTDFVDEFLKQVTREGGIGDGDKLLRLLADHADETKGRIMAGAYQCLTALFDNPRVWAATVALAKEIEQREILKRKTVAQLLKQSLGDPADLRDEIRRIVAAAATSSEDRKPR